MLTQLNNTKPECLHIVRYGEDVSILERTRAFSLEDVMVTNSKEKQKERYRKKYAKHKKRIQNDPEYAAEYKKKWKEYDNSPALFKTYAHRLIPAVEDPKDDGNGYLLTRCTYCHRYFYPTNRMTVSRIVGIKNYGDDKRGEQRLYCSNGCKKACSIYKQKQYPKGFKPATSREVDPLVRQMALKRDNYTCQKCEKGIDEIELHAHHIEGATQMPMLSNDIGNVITFCKPCHKWIHTQDGCRYMDLKCK